MASVPGLFVVGQGDDAVCLISLPSNDQVRKGNRNVDKRDVNRGRKGIQKHIDQRIGQRPLPPSTPPLPLNLSVSAVFSSVSAEPTVF